MVMVMVIVLVVLVVVMMVMVVVVVGSDLLLSVLYQISIFQWLLW